MKIFSPRSIACPARNHSIFAKTILLFLSIAAPLYAQLVPVSIQAKGSNIQSATYVYSFTVVWLNGAPPSVTAVGPASPAFSVSFSRLSSSNPAYSESDYQILVPATTYGTYTVTARNLYGSASATFAVSPPPIPQTAPIISSQPSTVSITLSSDVTLSVVASGYPLPTYQWRKDGANLAGQTVAMLQLKNIQISDEGDYEVIVSNPNGTVRSTIAKVTVNFAPSIATQPLNVRATEGDATQLTVAATGKPIPSIQWRKDGLALPGQTGVSLTLTKLQTSDAGIYEVIATNQVGTITSASSTLTVVALVIPPTISAAPANLTVLAGAKSTLTVTPAGAAPFTFQWLRNGTPISGATSTTFTLESTLVPDAAAYSVSVTNSAGSVTSTAATLTVTPISRISNLSVLTSLSDSADSFTLGYVIGGNATSGPKPLLVRAAGPSLSALGVGGTLDDPKLELFAGSTKTNENDNWGNLTTSVSALTAAFTSVGAFPFASPTSRDAALTASLTTRDNSVKISASTSTPALPTGAAAVPGLVLAEVYDATPTDTFTTATPRLLNVSVLKSLGTGLTVGFTIAGTTAKTVLIRAIGPTLGAPPFNVPGTVADPQLTLFNSASAKLAENDNWSVLPAQATALTTAFTSVGAFPLPAGSRDAALLTTLPPGGYSVQVSGVNNTTGVALVEVYEVP